MKNTNSKNSPMARVMSLRDFRLLFAGAAASLLGDQFALIATPWLVLKMTSDPLALGIVLALEGLPRAVFMLLGGAITDLLSPRVVMLIADGIRFILTAVMAALVFTGIANLWMIYAFGLAFGLVAGFAIPAENSIVPMLVEEQDLQAGNSIMMGITQLVGFVGPTVAGILIANYSSSALGIGLAFTIDSVSFIVSAVSLWLIRTGIRTKPAGDENVWASILAGIKYLWNDKVLRLMFMVLMTVNFLLIGPLMVGIPVLAETRLPEGAKYHAAGHWLVWRSDRVFGDHFFDPGGFCFTAAAWTWERLYRDYSFYLDADPHAERDARPHDGAANVLQLRPGPNLPGNFRRSVQMEPDPFVCLSRSAGFVGDPLDRFSTRS